MLVLSRKAGEKVVIAGDITVTITRVAGGRVTLGIEAPSHVRVVRGELSAKGERREAEADLTAESDLTAEPTSPRAGQSTTEVSAQSGPLETSDRSLTAERQPASLERKMERRMGRGRFMASGQAAAN
ncbi:MAG: carbon storage regulator [Pirellulales bacterium]